MVFQINGYNEHEYYHECDDDCCATIDSASVIVDLVLIKRFFVRFLGKYLAHFS